MSVQTLIEKLQLGFKLLMPDRALKFFPPDFTFRRPEIALLKKRASRDGDGYLALFRLDFSMLHQEVPNEIWDELQNGCRRQMKISAGDRLPEDSLIALRQYSRTDYALLAWSQDKKEHGAIVPFELRCSADIIRSDVEIALASLFPAWRHCLKVTVHCVPVESLAEPRGTEQALENAYQLALALATRQWTTQTEAMRKQLERFLDEGAVSVLSQPIMNLSTGDIYGWEILARGPEGSYFHMPDELFRFATQTRLLSRLEFMIVKRALEEIASRRIREPVFLNVTAVTLSHPLFLQHVLQCLEHHPLLSPKQIYFEITERHEVADLEAMAGILREFRKYGFRFAVDDAGAGYSSLQWISELVPELIKIDRSVIQQVDRVAIKESLLRALLTAAREMKCEVVAEGVEREEEADVLFRLDVAMGQGFYFARPNVLLHEHEREIFREMKEKIQLRRGQVAS
ncbi:EAL domain-containing protein [Cohnella faecalis]|uniref:EAL domain-containing protein n=1 Tax=Cohnella faecalis TaxID=2315694 RepID=A0A398CN89_9BACL|nr:EAL domain-containing protein [Cohnella faecalis]RIE04073.1 EAL domain-containing protein [Cohnella faecalis]